MKSNGVNIGLFNLSLSYLYPKGTVQKNQEGKTII